MPLRILFVDDEELPCEIFRMQMQKLGHEVAVCPDGETAIDVLNRDTFDCMFVDVNMPGASGIEVLKHASAVAPFMDSVVVTGRAAPESALEAAKLHAFGYLIKPVDANAFSQLIGRIAQYRKDQQQLRAMRLRLNAAEGQPILIGEHPSMDRVRQLVSRVAPTESTVLVRGETGCGKELVARSVHEQSLRSGQPWVAINCGALPENLIESELFGHCRGAFTGADAARQGLLQVADGGTVFLDEIGELPIAMQAKLLRFLETGEIRPVGDNQTHRVNVRIVCATHRDLEQMVADELFREDLMFRINAFEVDVPPLRQRINDIPSLATHLLQRFKPGIGDDGLHEDTIRALCDHVWPGNVRELANVIEHAVILCDTAPVMPEHLPRHFSRRRLRKELETVGPMTLRQLENMAIQQAMQRHDGNKTAVAEELGIGLRTLYNRLNSESVKETVPFQSGPTAESA